MARVTGAREALTDVGPDVEVDHRGASAGAAGDGRAARCVWAVLRLLMGWTFSWAFIDKLFGLGVATSSESAWLNGGSPTLGFLKFATHGPFADAYQTIAGNAFVDALFMAGLAGVGLSLLLGIGVRMGAVSGVAMLLLMYTAASLPPENNPFVHERLVYAVVMVGLLASGSGRTLGLGRWWERTALVQRFPILR